MSEHDTTPNSTTTAPPARPGVSRRSFLGGSTLAAIAVSTFVAPAVGVPAEQPVASQTTRTPVRPSPTPARTPAATPIRYLDQLSFNPSAARAYAEIGDALALTPAERDLFNANGFVLSDRIAFEDFVHAYA